MAKSEKLPFLLSLPNSALLALLAVLQSRWLGIVDRGLVVLILSIAGSSAVIGSLGYGLARVGSSFVRLNFRDFLSRIQVSVSLSVFIFLAIAIFHRIDVDVWIISFLLLASITYSSFFILTDVLFNSNLSIHLRSIALLTVIAELVSNVLLHYSSQLSLHKVFLVNSIVGLAGVSVILLFTRKYIDFKAKRSRFDITDFPFLITYLSSFFYVYIFRLPASYVINPAELAVISISFSFAFVGIPLIYFVMQYARTNTMNSKTIEKRIFLIIGMLFLFLMTIALSEFFFAKELIQNTVGREFNGAIVELQIISFAVPFFALFIIYLSIRQAQTANSQAMASGAYLIINALMILILGGLYGGVGICIGVLVLHFFLGTFGGIQLFRLRDPEWDRQLK